MPANHAIRSTMSTQKLLLKHKYADTGDAPLWRRASICWQHSGFLAYVIRKTSQRQRCFYLKRTGAHIERPVLLFIQ